MAESSGVAAMGLLHGAPLDLTGSLSLNLSCKVLDADQPGSSTASCKGGPWSHAGVTHGSASGGSDTTSGAVLRVGNPCQRATTSRAWIRGTPINLWPVAGALTLHLN